ncbi:MAG: amino acid permease [Gemmatimonadota bacterium]|nr:amino acid permease [Gemmatimonadota bacterium]
MSQTLKRTLGSRDLILIVIGSVIGSGIFIVPAGTLRLTGGHVGPALTVWLVGGVLSLLGALTYAELGAMNPEAGGLYVYIRDAFGPLPAFLYGWTLLLVLGSGTVAALAAASINYLRELVPVGQAAGMAIAVGMIVAIAALNVRSTRESATALNWSTLIKAGGIMVLSLLLVIRRPADAPGFGQIWPDRLDASTLGGVGIAMIGVLWAYEGWQWVTFSTGETVDPQRIFPRAIVLGTAALVVIYLTANLAYITVLGPAAAAQSTRIAAQSVTTALGVSAGKIVAALILVSMFSAAHSTVLTVPRVFYAMARDGVFIRKLAEVDPRSGTPWVAISACCAVAIALTLSNTFDQLLTYVVFAGWIFYGLAALSIFVYRRRMPDAARPFRVPGYPLTPALFVLAAAAIVGNTLREQPRIAFVGLAIVLSGVPAFYLWKRMLK